MMQTFTRYLDAWRYCRASGLSMAAIQKTGYSEYTVIPTPQVVVAHMQPESD